MLRLTGKVLLGKICPYLMMVTLITSSSNRPKFNRAVPDRVLHTNIHGISTNQGCRG